MQEFVPSVHFKRCATKCQRSRQTSFKPFVFTATIFYRTVKRLANREVESAQRLTRSKAYNAKRRDRVPTRHFLREFFLFLPLSLSLSVSSLTDNTNLKFDPSLLLRPITYLQYSLLQETARGGLKSDLSVRSVPSKSPADTKIRKKPRHVLYKPTTTGSPPLLRVALPFTSLHKSYRLA